jgi:hypothetical protein
MSGRIAALGLDKCRHLPIPQSLAATAADQCCHRSTSAGIAALPTSLSVATLEVGEHRYSRSRRSVATRRSRLHRYLPTRSVLPPLDFGKHRYLPISIGVATARYR